MADNLLSAVIGAVVGALAAATVNWLQGRAREQRTRLGVRALLRLEAAHNLATLNEFWHKVTSKQFLLPGVGYEHEVEYLHYRYRLAKQALQPWGLLMWESQAGLIADALAESEIEQAYKFYADLARFTLLRTQLQDAFYRNLGRMVTEHYYEVWVGIKRDHTEEQYPDLAKLERDLPVFASLFNQETLDYWTELQGIHNRANQFGNPILKDVPVRRLSGWLKMPRLLHRGGKPVARVSSGETGVM